MDGANAAEPRKLDEKYRSPASALCAMRVSRYPYASMRLTRMARSVLPPLALALAPSVWVIEATRRASLTPLGRDQGIFQYVAWSLTQGQVDYRDVRDVNGSLTHLVHLAFLALGGADEHRFRVLDLLVTGLTFALVGTCLPGLGSRRRPDLVERLAWGVAAWVVLSAQYLLYGYWDLAQRESFCDWFLLPALALQLVAQAPAPAISPGRAGARRALLAAVGALSVIPWFGKPTYALFTLAQLVTLVVDRSAPGSRRGRVLAFVCGGALGALSQLVFLAALGSPLAFARIQLADVPAMYRFIWPRAAMDIFAAPWCATQAIFALAGAVTLLGLVALREMPTRVLAVALTPLCATLGVIVQGKGFPYHFHPLTAGVHLEWLVFAAWLGERTRVARRDRAPLRVLPLVAGVALSLRIATAMEDSPHIRAAWLLWGARTPAERSTPAYFAQFPEVDFFPYELRQTAAYLRQKTQPADRVQTYGMDAYLLFLARRVSATPYIYAYDLNADAALAGGTGGRPDRAQAEHIRALRDAHEADMRLRLSARPPAAFVFLDDAPLLTRSDAWDDFEEHCPSSAAWVRARYRETASFGHNHVWLRQDLAALPDASPDERPSEKSR